MPKIRVAWIEDDIDELDPLLDPLRRDGAEVLEYRTYSEAIEGVHELQGCDAILLDIILPPGRSDVEGDYLGIDLLKRLREEFAVTCPVILLSLVANARDVVTQGFLREFKATPLDKIQSYDDLKSELGALVRMAGESTAA